MKSIFLILILFFSFVYSNAQLNRVAVYNSRGLVNYENYTSEIDQIKTELAELKLIVDSIKINRDFDPIKFYDRNGITKRPTKIWRDTFAVTTPNGQSIDISSASFSNVRTVTVTVLHNTTDANAMADATVKSWTTTAVVVNITQAQTFVLNTSIITTGITILPRQFLLNPTTTGAKIVVTATGD